MNHGVKNVLCWMPRILCLLFAASLSLFALDVFGEHSGFWETLVGLLMHLVPTFAALIVLAVSWRWELSEPSSLPHSEFCTSVGRGGDLTFPLASSFQGPLS